MYPSRLKKTFQNMKSRCYNPNASKAYLYYGKGITICDEWLNDRTKFYKWSIENGYNDNLTIDRIDGTKGYSPDNCRWTTYLEQAKNTTNKRFIEFNGEIKRITEWGKITGLSAKCIDTRISRGWSVYDALFTPKLDVAHDTKEKNGRFKTKRLSNGDFE